MSNAHQVALYQVATLPLTAAALASAPLRMALLPEFARLYAAGALEALRQAVRTYVRVAAALGALGVLVGWLVLPRLVVLVFGDDYVHAGRIGRVVLIAAALELMLGWGKLLVPAAGRPQLRTAVAAIQLTLVVSVLAWLGGDAEAGATAVTITSGAGCLLWWLVYRQLLARSRIVRPTSDEPVDADRS
jgi:O-antigen/teichoic acid export membrane protein